MRNKSGLQVGPQASLKTKRIIRDAGALFLSTVAVVAMVQMAESSVSVSGIINDYATATDIQLGSITLDDASAFDEGDKIVILQAKGAIIDETDDSTYGDIVSLGEAGNYEFAEISHKSGNTLDLVHSLCYDYQVDEQVQVIRVAYYDKDVVVDGDLTAPAWDGSKGGVLVLESTGNIELEANINLNGLGFRGGAKNGSATRGGLTYICEFNSGKGGIKGEGIIDIPQAACRGKLATGGGGGNDHNGGGGGGGNYGAGGIGGDGWKSNTAGNLSDLDKGGRGGEQLSSYYEAGIPKLFLGGGGGGGHQNNGATYPAANGGGIIILICNNLDVKTNISMDASGDDAEDINVNDGAGGGGAGGSVLLSVESFTGSDKLSIDVSGGDGATINTRDQHGPGGGGGGGYVNSRLPLPNDIAISYEGGEAGLFITSNSNNPFRNTPHGASTGQDGAIVNNFMLQICSEPPVLDLDKNNSGNGYSTTFYRNVGETPIADQSKISIEDEDDSQMDIAWITLSNPEDGSKEYLVSSLSPTELTSLGLSMSTDSNKHSITLSGRSSLANYYRAISSLNYKNEAPNPNTNTRIINTMVNDGGANSNNSSTQLTMSTEILPVEWSWFQVKEENGHAHLSWATASETNADFYEVERSGQNGIFKSIGKIKAQGTTTKQSNYGFTDTNINNLQEGRLVYRLKQVDFDGAFDYSKRIELALREDIRSEFLLNVYPDPIDGQMHFGIRCNPTEHKFASLKIMDIRGNVIIQQEIRIEGYKTEFQLEGEKLQPGIYIASSVSGEHMQSRKFVIQE